MPAPVPLLALLLTRPAGAVAVAGRVTDEAGAPLEGVAVYVYDLRLGYAWVSTDAEGRFRLERLPAGRYRLRAVPPQDADQLERYYPGVRDFCEGELLDLRDGDLEGVELALPAGLSASGRLLADGAPVEGARVLAEGAGELEGRVREASTDAEGRFLLRGLEPGDGWLFRAELEDWPAQYYGGVYDDDEAEPLAFSERDRELGDWELLPGISVAGRVYGPDGPVEGASVHVYSSGQVVNLLSDEDGGFDAWGLPPGSVLPWFSADGLATTYYPDADRPGDFLEAPEEGDRLEGVELEAPWESVFRGRLLGDGDLSGVTALLYNDERTVGFGNGLEADGSFAIGSLHGGDYLLYLYAAEEGYVDGFVADEDGEPRLFHVEPETEMPEEEIELPRGARLAGTVVDDEGEPVYGAVLYATEQSTGEISATTASRDGSWELPGLSPGTYTLQAGYSPICASDPGWVTVYWNGALTDELAAPLVLERGEERGGLDFVLPRDDDHDGMGDAWEREHGLDPTRDDSAEDPDGDGYTNLEEYRLGTDPTQAVDGGGCGGCSGGGEGGPWLPLPLLLALRRRGRP